MHENAYYSLVKRRTPWDTLGRIRQVAAVRHVATYVCHGQALALFRGAPDLYPPYPIRGVFSRSPLDQSSADLVGGACLI